MRPVIGGLPTRVSVDRADPGWAVLAHQFVVSLDGVAVNDCITADSVAGYILRYRRGSDGQAALVDASDKGTVEQWGKVTISLRSAS